MQSVEVKWEKRMANLNENWRHQGNMCRDGISPENSDFFLFCFVLFCFFFLRGVSVCTPRHWIFKTILLLGLKCHHCVDPCHQKSWLIRCVPCDGKGVCPECDAVVHNQLVFHDR